MTTNMITIITNKDIKKFHQATVEKKRVANMSLNMLL